MNAEQVAGDGFGPVERESVESDASDSKRGVLAKLADELAERLGEASGGTVLILVNFTMGQYTNWMESRYGNRLAAIQHARMFVLTQERIVATNMFNQE